MIEKLTNYIVDCQIASGKIKEEEGSVYRYGYTLFFEKLCITKEIVYVIFEVITLLALIFIIPTQNPNKKLSQNELKKYKKVSFIIWLVQCCLLVVFFVYQSY